MILGGIAMQYLATLAMSGDVTRSHRIVLGVLLVLLLIKTFAELVATYTIGFLRFGLFHAFYLSCVEPRVARLKQQDTASDSRRAQLPARLHRAARLHTTSPRPLSRSSVARRPAGIARSHWPRIRLRHQCVLLAGQADRSVTYLADIVRADVPFDPVRTFACLR